MNTELDEVYVASIKEMFKEFDDEIIWTAIFEHGYNSDNTYNLENVVNYLLELSTDISTQKNIENNTSNTSNTNNKNNTNNISNNKNNKKIDDDEPYNNSDKFIIPPSNVNENTGLLDLEEEDYEEAEEIKPNMFQNITDLISSNNNGYHKIEDK